jgi:hypothetical protein
MDYIILLSLARLNILRWLLIHRSNPQNVPDVYLPTTLSGLKLLSQNLIIHSKDRYFEQPATQRSLLVCRRTGPQITYTWWNQWYRLPWGIVLDYVRRLVGLSCLSLWRREPYIWGVIGRQILIEEVRSLSLDFIAFHWLINNIF